MPARCVDGYEVIRARGERAFQKAIVRFVTNNTQLGQRMAEFATLDYLGNKRWLVAEDIAVLFENRRAGPRFDETSAYKLKHERADVGSSPEMWPASGHTYQERLSRYGFARRNVRARRFASTNSMASRSVMFLPRFARWARTSAGESLKRTTLPFTIAVACISQS